MIPDYEIHKLLVLSTAHVKRSTLDAYDRHDYVNPYGLFAYTSAEQGDEDTPDDMRVVLALAAQLGCAWVKLDCDGKVIEGLPTYAEDEAAVTKEQPLTAEAPCGAPVVWTPEDVQRLEVALAERFGPALETTYGVDPAQWADGDVIKLDTDGCVVIWNEERLRGENTGQQPSEFGYMTPDELVRCVASKQE